MRKIKRFMLLAAAMLVFGGCSSKEAPESVDTPVVSVSVSSVEDIKEPDTESSVSVSTSVSVSASVDKEPEVSVSVEDTKEEVTKEKEPEKKEAIKREDFPVFDGSTSLRPLGVGIASVMLGETRESVDKLFDFHKTDEAYTYMFDGLADILIAAEGCDYIMESYSYCQYEREPIAMEGLVFIVNVNNPVNSLTSEQVKKIYAGEITNWSEVGGEDLEITAFQRNEESGSQVMMRKCVMTDYELVEAPTELIPGTMGGLIDAVAAYDNSASALGYTVYYYADSMKMADGLKIISIDGIEPSNDTIGSGKYPFINPYYCLILADKEEASSARRIYNWLVTKEGQSLVEREGYVPVRDVKSLDENKYYPITDWTNYTNAGKEVSLPKEEKYTVISGDTEGLYEAGTSNGYIFPYKISEKFIIGDMNIPDEYPFYGFVDETGKIVSEHGYASVTRSGDFWLADDQYISLDGKLVLDRNTNPWGGDRTYLYCEDDVYYRYFIKDRGLDDFWGSEDVEVYQDLYETIYDRDGNVLSDRKVDYDNSILQSTLPFQTGDTYFMLVDNVLVGKFLSVSTGTSDKGSVWGDDYVHHIMDVKSGKIIAKNLEEAQLCDNHTFVVKKKGEDKYTVLNCEGTVLSKAYYYDYCEYMGNGSYVAKNSGEKMKILKLEDSKLVEIASMEADSFFVINSFLAAKKKFADEYTYYDTDGNIIVPDENYKLRAALNAIDIGAIYLNEYTDEIGSRRHYKYYDVDPVTEDTSEPYYYYSSGDWERHEYEFINIATKEYIVTSDPNSHVINGKVMIENVLTDLKTGEVIFYKEPFIWDNVD